MSGQVPVDERGDIVGRGDSPAQARQVHDNLSLALHAAGATLTDVVHLDTFLADLRHLPELRALR